MQIIVTNLMQNTNIWVQDSDSILSETRQKCNLKLSFSLNYIFVLFHSI